MTVESINTTRHHVSHDRIHCCDLRQRPILNAVLVVTGNLDLFRGRNGSLIGAGVNLIVVGFAKRVILRIRFLLFILMALPLMIMCIVLANV